MYMTLKIQKKIISFSWEATPINIPYVTDQECMMDARKKRSVQLPRVNEIFYKLTLSSKYCRGGLLIACAYKPKW